MTKEERASEGGKTGGRGREIAKSQDATKLSYTATQVGDEFGVDRATILRDHKKGKKINPATDQSRRSRNNLPACRTE